MWFEILKTRAIKVKPYYQSIEREFDRWMMQNKEQAFTIGDIIEFIDLKKIGLESIEYHNEYKPKKIDIKPQHLTNFSNPNNRFASKIEYYLPRLLNKNGYEKLITGEPIWIKGSMRQTTMGVFND
jgi:hypothetical protein